MREELLHWGALAAYRLVEDKLYAVPWPESCNVQHRVGLRHCCSLTAWQVSSAPEYLLRASGEVGEWGEVGVTLAGPCGIDSPAGYEKVGRHRGVGH